MIPQLYGIQEDPDSLPRSVVKLLSFTEEFQTESSLRREAASDPHSALARYDIEYPASIDVRIVENTSEVFHLVLPPDPNAALADEDMLILAGGKSASSAGTAGTASCISSTVSSVSSAGSAGSAD